MRGRLHATSGNCSSLLVPISIRALGRPPGRTWGTWGWWLMIDNDALDGREEVLDALDILQAELADGVTWENDTLGQFLDAFSALLGSIENAYENTGRYLPESPWTLVAEALKGARFYE